MTFLPAQFPAVSVNIPQKEDLPPLSFLLDDICMAVHERTLKHHKEPDFKENVCVSTLKSDNCVKI